MANGQGDSTIAVCTVADEFFVVVCGRGTFLISEPLRAYGMAAVKNRLHHFCVDLSDCPGIDSTFMGVLAMIAQAGAKANLQVQLLNLQQKTKDQLRGLGIAGMFEYAERNLPAGPMEEVDTGQTISQRDLGKTALAAHEALIAEDAENEKRFGGVVGELKKDLDTRAGDAR